MNSNPEAQKGLKSESSLSSFLLGRIALDVPIAPWFDYRIPPELARDMRPFDWVVVPWARGQKVGLFLEFIAETEIPDDKLKTVGQKLETAPVLPPSWQSLVKFAARYYQRSLGEIALPAIPKPLREPPRKSERSSAIQKVARGAMKIEASQEAQKTIAADIPLALTDRQKAVMHQLREGVRAQDLRPVLLFGVTGSGKTEIYLQWFANLLATDPGAQVLLLVPEISLTPRLVELVRRRFPAEPTVVLHSGLAEMERAGGWLMAAQGRARLVIGTRLSVLTPMPGLRGIVVDEEHDPSFKQPDAAFSSARDLALTLASLAKVPIILGSATPSLESWHAAQRGRYQLITLAERATGAALPRIELVKPEAREVSGLGMSKQSAEAVDLCLAQNRQTLIFLNRRGYSPVLYCMHCGWLSQCNACSAYRVLHKMKSGYRLICHHCSQEGPVPRQCPSCGAAHLEPLGQGTQGLEEAIAKRFPKARIRRVDRDVAKHKGAVESILQEVHAGDADILVGTQMLAKGHDFKNLSLVIVLDGDGALYSGDFRARERLFATLMQVAGRAGRAAPEPGQPKARVLIETRFVEDPLFAALMAQDFEAFAAQELNEREQVGFPPYQFQALLRARSRSMPDALNWLGQARLRAETLLSLPEAARLHGQISMHDPVPMPMAKLAHFSRAQLLIESPTRKHLQGFLREWLAVLRAESPSHAHDLSWQLEMDPLEI